MRPSPLGICVASMLFYPLHRGAFGIKRLSRGGESIVEFYIFSALQWESLRYYCVSQIFMRYLRNCGLQFWYCGITKHAEFFMIGSAIFSMVHVRGVLIPFKGDFLWFGENPIVLPFKWNLFCRTFCQNLLYIQVKITRVN